MTRLNVEDQVGCTHELSVFLRSSCGETMVNKFSLTNNGSMLFERNMSGDGFFLKPKTTGNIMVCVKLEDGTVAALWDAKDCEVIKRSISPITVGVDDNWTESAEVRFEKCIERYGKAAGDKWREKWCYSSVDVVEEKL